MGSSSSKYQKKKLCFSIQNVFSFQYWHDPINLDEYVEKSQFIAEINNEKAVKNESYAENLKKLENFVMAVFIEVRILSENLNIFLQRFFFSGYCCGTSSIKPL